MSGMHVRFVVDKSLVICLFPLTLSLALAGCGGSGGQASLNDSARLTPAIEQAGPPVKELAKGESIPEKTAQVVGIKSEAGKKDQTESEQFKAVMAALADEPPVPVRRPYRKIRRKKQQAKAIPPKSIITGSTKVRTGVKAVVARQKVVSQKVAKPVIRKETKAAKVKKVVKKPIEAAPAAVPMVPVQVIPVQIVPARTPQDVLDAFNETPDSEEQTSNSSKPEKIAEAEIVQPRPSFGETRHRFAGQ